MCWRTTFALWLGLTSTFALASTIVAAPISNSDRADRARAEYSATRNANPDVYGGIRNPVDTRNPYAYNDDLAAGDGVNDDTYGPTRDRTLAHHQAALRAQANSMARLDRLARRTGRAPRLGHGTTSYGIVDPQGTRYRRRANIYQEVNPANLQNRHELMAERYANSFSAREAYAAGRNVPEANSRLATGGRTGRGVNRMPPGSYAAGGVENTRVPPGVYPMVSPESPESTVENRAARGTYGTGGAYRGRSGTGGTSRAPTILPAPPGRRMYRNPGIPRIAGGINEGPYSHR